VNGPLRALGHRAVAIPLALGILLAGILVIVVDGDQPRTVSAHFTRAVSLYVGSEVRILGVRVGKVTAVVPAGDTVRVDMEYDADYKVPADATAVVVSSTLVADRFVQLGPAWTGGPVMEDGATIELARTGAPVELDRVYSALDELSVALGPEEANKRGSLDELLAAGAEALEGQGAQGNRMLNDLSQAAETIGDGSGDMFSAVRQLDAFIGAVQRNDRFVRSFMTDLATVSGQLSGERGELQAALRQLSTSVGQVHRFIRDHRELLSSDVAKLTDVSRSLADKQATLGEILEEGALSVNNVILAMNPESRSMNSRLQLPPHVNDIDGFLCALVRRAETPAAATACRLFETLFEPLPDLEIGAGALEPLGGVVGGVVDELTPATTLEQLLGGRR
jgi:phospholipid/cholesterol/gamma-HCH transport system substrate-binding protein